MTATDTLGERVRWVRESLRLDQLGFAALVATGRAATVSDWETDKRTPELGALVKIVEEGRVDPWWLLTGEGEPHPPAPERDGRAMRLVRQIAGATEGELAEFERHMVKAGFAIKRIHEAYGEDPGRAEP